MIHSNSHLSKKTIGGSVVNSTPPRSAYVHLPFCRRRCFYCDFPVTVLGNSLQGDSSRTIGDYIHILCQEITIFSGTCQPLETIFFGGGTPSLVSVKQLERILQELDRTFGIESNAEISMEIDPQTFTLEQLQGYQSLGVNRVSLGSQAFQNELLQKAGRFHSVQDIYDAIELIQKAGFTNWSLDLISGLPTQTLSQWEESLNCAIGLHPPHLSCYDLIIEPRTAFSRYYQSGQSPLPSDEITAQMYRLAQQLLTNRGYQHYEISNYSLPGFACRHNQVYWHNQPFYGFGMGAASSLNGVRFTRPRTRREYYEWVQKLNPDCLFPPPEKLGDNDIFLDTLMLGLRLGKGVNLTDLSQKFGQGILTKLEACLQPYYQEGWLEILTETGEKYAKQERLKLPSDGYLRLQDPEGFLFSNTILATIFSQFTEGDFVKST